MRTQVTTTYDPGHPRKGADGKPKLGAGGTPTLTVNGKRAGSGNIGKTQFAVWSADETANVGMDRETLVPPDYDEMLGVNRLSELMAGEQRAPLGKPRPLTLLR